MSSEELKGYLKTVQLGPGLQFGSNPCLGVQNTYEKAKVHKQVMSLRRDYVLERVSKIAFVSVRISVVTARYLLAKHNFLMAASLQTAGTRSAKHRITWATPSLLDGTSICLPNFEHTSSRIGWCMLKHTFKWFTDLGPTRRREYSNENAGIQPRLWSWNTSFSKQSWGFQQTFSIKINGRYMS